MKPFVLIVSALCLSACTVVEVSSNARNVRLVEYSEVNDCRRLSEVTVGTTPKIGFIQRNHYTIQTELYDLARNEAVRQGGNRMVAANQPIEGVQRFDVYQCQTLNQ